MDFEKDTENANKRNLESGRNQKTIIKLQEKNK